MGHGYPVPAQAKASELVAFEIELALEDEETARRYLAEVQVSVQGPLSAAPDLLLQCRGSFAALRALQASVRVAPTPWLLSVEESPSLSIDYNATKELSKKGKPVEVRCYSNGLWFVCPDPRDEKRCQAARAQYEQGHYFSYETLYLTGEELERLLAGK